MNEHSRLLCEELSAHLEGMVELAEAEGCGSR